MSAALLLAALLLADGGANAPPPRAAVEPAAFDFGRLKAGRKVEKELVLRNHGGQELVVERVATDCGCAVVSGYEEKVAPAGRTVLRVAFTAPEKPGRAVKRVLVRTNDPVRPDLEVKLTAEVVADERPK